MRAREKCRHREQKRKKKKRGSGGRKSRERATGSRAADILVSLSLMPGESTYMDPETSSNFMVARGM